MWTVFCEELRISTTLSDVADPETRLSYLLVFGLRYRRAGQTGKPVRSEQVDKALLAVGQGISDLGRLDPRKQAPGSSRNHPLLASFLKSLSDQDSPTSRVHPANLDIVAGLADALDFEHKVYGPFNQHVFDLAIVAFYWLLRPGEYAKPESDEPRRTRAFRLRDVHYTYNGTSYQASTAPLHDKNAIAHYTHASLEFFDQKNAVRGEKVGHAATSHPLICPVKALGRIVHRLRSHRADPNTPLYQHFNPHPKHRRWYSVTARHITNALRHSANLLEPRTGIPSELISARSLRPGGATALLCANVDSDTIRLLGRWRSDAMFRYLQVQAVVQSRNLASLMLQHGRYTFAPGVNTDDLLPRETPPEVINLLDAPDHMDN